MRKFLVILAMLAVPVFAAPVLVGSASGVSPCSAACADEFVATVPAGSAGDVLVVVFGTGPTPDGGGQCPGISDAGWSPVFNKAVGNEYTGKDLCAYSKVSDGTESAINAVRPDMNGVAWFVARVSGASVVSAVAVAGGNPPSISLPSAAVVLAAEYGKATTGPAGYTLDFAASSGGVRAGLLSVADTTAFGASEDPGAFAPLGNIAATIAVR